MKPDPWYAEMVQLARNYDNLLRLALAAKAAGEACAASEAAFDQVKGEYRKAQETRAAAREACNLARKALTEATTAKAIIEAGVDK